MSAEETGCVTRSGELASAALLPVVLALATALSAALSFSGWARAILIWSYVPVLIPLLFLAVSFGGGWRRTAWSVLRLPSLVCAGFLPFVTWWERGAVGGAYFVVCKIVALVSCLWLLQSVNVLLCRLSPGGRHLRLSYVNSKLTLYFVMAPLLAGLCAAFVESGFDFRYLAVGGIWMTTPAAIGIVHLSLCVASLCAETVLAVPVFIHLLNNSVCAYQPKEQIS